MLLSLWSLDPIRAVNPPFCLHHKMTILHVLALDYLVGVYPLFLILITYIAVRLHDRYSLAEKMWRPAYSLLVRIRREWDMRGSLLEAFATFMVLSFMKILNISFDLLRPVYLKNADGQTLSQAYLYIDGEITFFGSEHLPYSILAIVMLLLFNLVPVVLLLLYPCPCCLSCLTNSRIPTELLYPLINTFQGCYHHNNRCFAGFYLVIRFVFLVTLALTNTNTSAPIFGFYFIALSIILILSNPYKENIHNKINTAVFLFGATTSFIFGLYVHIRPTEPQLPIRTLFNVLISPLAVTFLLYGITMMIQNVVPKKAFVAAVRCWQHIKTMSNRTETDDDTDKSFLQQLEQE